MEKELLCILKKYETHPDFFGDTIKDINQVGGMDDTVLHIAARNNSLNDALVFLQNGALIDLKGDLGYTPLHYACMFGNIEMVKLLLDNGSDKNIQNEFGENAPKTREQVLTKYKIILNDVKASLEKEPELGFARHAWMVFVGQKEKLATFAMRYYSYTGGPHGVGGNEYLTVDMTTHKVLTLSDIIDQKKLPEVKELLWSFYTDYGRIKDEDAFTKKTDFDVSKNFYLAHDGIHFIYDEYEIASYADGEQDLVISWGQLQLENLLMPDFVKQKYYDFGYTEPYAAPVKE